MEAIFGLDVRDPEVAFDRLDFVHADLRHAALPRLVRGLAVDTVVHCAVLCEGRTSARETHETDVIGTMNLLTACSGPDATVRRVVVKSSVAVYGAWPGAPSFLREDAAGQQSNGNSLQADLGEMEQLVHDFALRYAERTVTVLRFGFRLGIGEGTAFARYLGLPVVPTLAGYDPRIQFLHEQDAVEALCRAALARHRGVFNVAGAGVVLLSQAVGLVGRRPLPVLPPFARWTGRWAMRALGVDLPSHLPDVLAYGCVVDIGRLEREFGWVPPRSSREVLREFRGRLSGEIAEPPPAPQEAELERYLQRRRRLAP